MPLLSDVSEGALPAVAITHWPAAWRVTYELMGKRSVTGPDSVWQAGLLNHPAKSASTKSSRASSSAPTRFTPCCWSHWRTSSPCRRFAPIITDSISVNRIWVMSGSDLFCVADDETRRRSSSVLACRSQRSASPAFPVNLAFTEPLPESRRACRRSHPIPALHHGTACGATLEALRPLLLGGTKLTLPVGKHASRLHHILRRFTDSLPPGTVDIIGWTKRIPEFLRTHDVVICKAGGAILHEVLAAKIPAVIDYVVPGQEEGNAEVLTKMRRRCRHQHRRRRPPLPWKASSPTTPPWAAACVPAWRSSACRMPRCAPPVPRSPSRNPEPMHVQPPVSVVCAIIVRGDRVLLAQRPPDKKLGGLWEFPGGKVERGESAEAALHRELA
jgi:processive 1,2-diacylglycerol beta-glucosyltransferase